MALEQISGPKYRSRTPGLPFFTDAYRLVGGTGRYVVRLEVNKIERLAQFADRYEAIRNAAVDNFIMHYYPELWPGVNNALASIPSLADYQDLYNALRASIYDATTLNGFYQPAAPPTVGARSYSLVVATYKPPLGVDAIRKQLKNSTFGGQNASSYFPTYQDFEGNVLIRGLPPMEPAVAYYNSIQPKGGITGEGAESTFIVGSMMRNQDIVNNGLHAFAMQLAAFPGGLNSNLNMTFLQQDVQQFLNLFIRTLVNQFSTQQETREFDEADTLTIYFGSYADEPDSVVISRMEYLVVDESPSPQTLAVGYLTNMSYNASFTDPLTVSMLRNYEDTLEGMMNMQGPYAGSPMMMDGEQFSFYTFAEGLGPGALGPTSENWEEFKFITPIVNEAAEEIADGYVKAAIEAGLPVDTKRLSEGIEVALTSKELRELRDKVLNNPELAQKVFAEQKAKTLKAGINVSKKLGNILEKGPLGFVKKNSPLDQVFRQFGIQELAKEAFRCLTFGLAPELGRINTAVQKALTNQAGSIYLPPPTPPAASISKPDIDLEMFKPFSFTGDIWKQILKAIVDGLRNSVLEIVKELANVLNELCDFNNPFAEDFGAQDITDFLPSEPDIYGAGDPSSALQGMADRMGVPRNTIFQYLASLSSILSSMEICFLFTDPSQVTDELLKRIIEFNLNYDDEYVSTVMTNRNTIMAFFANLATIVDVTKLCDEIANALYELNQDDICLTEGDLANALENQNIDSLLDLMENGLQLELPPLSFECPDKAGFIDNPLFSRAVPETLNLTTELVEMQFMTSTQAALNVLLEPSVAVGPSVAGATLAALAEIEPDSGPESETTQGAADMALLDTIANKFQDFSENLEQALASQSCASLGDKSQTLLSATEALNEIFASGDFLEAMQNIEDTFTNLSSSLSGAAASNQTPRVTYVFPTQYTTNFSNYLPSSGPVWQNNEVTTQNLLGVGQERVVAGLFGAHTADDTGIAYNEFVGTGPNANSNLASANNISITAVDGLYDSYKDLDLTFTFNSLGRTDALRLSYPRFDSAISSEMSGTALSFATVTLSSSQTTAYLPDRVQFQITSSILEIMDSHFVPTLSTNLAGMLNANVNTANRLQTNPYVHRFTGPVMDNLRPLLSTMNQNQKNAVREEIETQLFPSLFAGLTKAMFNYVSANGTFDAPGVRALQLFKDNTNCPPALVADLLDADGILTQVKAEFLESACFDEMPLDLKIRYGTMLALFYNLIQVEIAELIIKNIFVFTAFQVDELLATPTIAQFIASQVRNDVLTKLQRYPRVRQAIIEYYNFKIARAPVASQGGLLDYNEQVVFPVGTAFSSANWDALVEYLVNQRVHWAKTPVANVVRMAGTDSSFKKSLDEVFVQDILGFGSRLSWEPSTQTPNSDDTFETTLVNRTIGSPLAYGTLLIERVVSWSGVKETGPGGVPEVLEPTRNTGGELEVREFCNGFFDGTPPVPLLAKSVNIGTHNWGFEFLDLALKYRLVYYLPSEASPAAERPGSLENYTSLLTRRAMQITQEGGTLVHSPGRLARETLKSQVVTQFEYTDDNGPVDADIQYGVGPNGQELIRVKVADFDDISTRQTLTGFTTMIGLKELLNGPQFNEDTIPTTTSRAARREEARRIARDPTYKKFFTETFNQGFITMIPVYQNLYLTDRYFGKIETTFDSTKNFIIQAFIDVVTGKDPRPPVGNARPNAAAALRNSAGPDFAARFEGLGRDFILKMLIETPIMILKGLAEMIDPHVALWKIVRNATGMAFDEASKAIDASGVMQTVDDELDEAGIPPLGLRGEDLIALVLCLLDFGLTQAVEDSLEGAPPLPEDVVNNILPKLSLDGIDFTGTLSGMLMIPPLPFGILYILLDLLKKHLAEELTSDDNELSGEESLPEC